LDLGALRAVLSTGSVLYDEQFTWVRNHVKPLPLQSISGGTDILGCFVLGNPNLPVYAGEAQCKSLGLDVQAWKEGARADGIGELVCTNPFPSRPVGFFGDTDGAAFHAAYFAQNAGAWTHGDLIEFSAEGAARLHGRSDGALKVRGIAVAPGEIYRALKSIPEIREAMVVEQRPRDASGHQPSTQGVDQRIILLLVLRDSVALDGALVAKVRRELARRLSPAHVPDRILDVAELPVTHSGKLSDAAARKAVNGLPIDNASALRNPGCLETIRNHPALRAESTALPATIEGGEQLEAFLKAQWEKLFGFGPIGLDDNFFELGGNSLLAARLLAEVRQFIGRPLPLALLLVTPTIRQLAKAIADGTQLPSSPAPVPMRAGTGAPLFLVHGLSGSVMECWAMVGALQAGRPVYGLQARGLDGEQAPQDRVEEIAANYVEQMRRVQPHGPYAVTGYSFGGLVAIEIAQQLLRAGERIELLCLLDTYARQGLPWTARLQHRWNRARRKAAELSPWQLLGYAARKLWRSRERPLADAAVVPPAQLVFEKMLAAMENYRPQPYGGGPIVYVRAAIALGDYFDPLPLWQRIAEGGLVIADVPGGHLDMQGPNAQRVAAALDRALAGA
jgi:acetoacetyl-CoA synthetase